MLTSLEHALTTLGLDTSDLPFLPNADVFSRARVAFLRGALTHHPDKPNRRQKPNSMALLCGAQQCTSLACSSSHPPESDASAAPCSVRG